jgi:hypothetical protein
MFILLLTLASVPLNPSTHRKEEIMKFSDFFIPKIARSDPKVREKAIIACKDKELLKRVIQHEKDENVRQVAKQCLEDLMDRESNGQGAYTRQAQPS